MTCSQCTASKWQVGARSKLIVFGLCYIVWCACSVAKQCLILFDPMYYRLPSSSVPGISFSKTIISIVIPAKHAINLSHIQKLIIIPIMTT